MAKLVVSPTLDLELDLWRQGYRAVAGVDEAGRGALAGPVVAAAVVLPPVCSLGGVWANVRDSKLLSAEDRVSLEAEIHSSALGWSVGVVSSRTIDAIGIAPATRQAMAAAVTQLRPPADFLIIDWVRLTRVNLPQESRVRADLTVVSVAAASILAKVHRDRLLVEMGEQYPVYAFARNKGYGTAQHRAALDEFGPCREHRYSFSPIAAQPNLFCKEDRLQDATGTSAPAAEATLAGDAGESHGE